MTSARHEANAIVCRDLRKSFTVQHQVYGSVKVAAVNALRRRPRETIEVLKGLNVTIPTGQTVALIGRNGSGKSTLLSLIARVYRPTSGTVEVNGAIAPLLELGAGFHPDLTVIENIELYAAILGMRRAEVRAKLDAIVAFAFDAPDLAAKIDTPLRNYSEGMKMRLGFSIAIHTDPSILLVDEVLAVGDEAFQAKCFRRIEEIQAQGKTIVFVSHDMNVVRRAATRVIWLADGVIRLDGSTEDVVRAYIEASS
ncbi:MAG: ABC transporter ATP-binding protein [Chthonomonadales bacterium]|nr:ABC transporter ATP-binding protein [Chthonomonadales bacterium]